MATIPLSLADSLQLFASALGANQLPAPFTQTAAQQTSSPNNIPQSVNQSVPSQGPIAKLPPELLSEIFSHLLRRQVGKVRLVCRGFRDCAWPAFGDWLGETDFDIRSMESMRNLRAISENPLLAPHVTKLNFQTGFVSSEFPGEQLVEDGDGELIPMEPEDYMEDMDGDEEGGLLAELKEFSKQEKYWFDHTWEWTPCISHIEDFMTTYAVKESKKLVIDFLAITLSKFNLREVNYTENTVPAHFRGLRTEIMEEAQRNGVVHWREPLTRHQMAIDINGLDILLNALAASNARIKELTIPVLVQYGDSLITYTSPDIVREVMVTIEVLDIRRSDKEAFHHHVDEELEVLLSSCAPKLQHLSCHLWTPNEHFTPPWMTHVSLTKAIATYSPIRHLTLCCSYNTIDPEVTSFNQSFFTWLTCIGGTLKELDLHLFPTLQWIEMVRFLVYSTEVNLDKLWVVAHARNCKKTSYFIEGIKTPKKEFLQRAARKVDLGDEDFEVWLEKRWVTKMMKKEEEGYISKICVAGEEYGNGSH